MLLQGNQGTTSMTSARHTAHYLIHFRSIFAPTVETGDPVCLLVIRCRQLATVQPPPQPPL
jgi:hypothetical protein